MYVPISNSYVINMHVTIIEKIINNVNVCLKKFVFRLTVFSIIDVKTLVPRLMDNRCSTVL